MENTFFMAGKNKKELKRVLRYYKKDTLKYQAACFLIRNMKWHASREKIDFIDPRLESNYRKIDSIFHAVSEGMTLKELTSYESRKVFIIKERITHPLFNYAFKESIIRNGYFPDPENISADLLISHVDNAFRIRNSNPYISRLTFREFCEYILPYRSGHYSLFNDAAILNKMFSTYLNNESLNNLEEKIKFFNDYLFRMKCLFGKCPIKGNMGIYDLFQAGKHDCIALSSYAANIFRACGYPSAVDFYAAHKELYGRHYFCSLLDSTGIWKTFSPGTNTPDEMNLNKVTNTFRITFSPQKDNPYTLRNGDEYLPPIFNTPCIMEITGESREVEEIYLPAPQTVKNKLAYLYVFRNNSKGETAATWGEIDSSNNRIRFKNVLYDVLYFPVYFEGEKKIYFTSPFWISKNQDKNGYILHRLDELFPSKEKRENVILTRKFPRKEKMIKRAENMIGGQFIASNDIDFKDAKILHTIRKTPDPYLQEIIMDSPVCFQHYRYVAPNRQSNNISHIEFITDPKYGYDNVANATPLTDFFHYKESGTDRIKLINKSKYIAASIPWLDGKMNTVSPGSHITFSLEEPQVVTSISFSPIHADNGIKRNHRYTLMYWNDGWKSFSSYNAKHEFLIVENLPTDRLYWLRNMTEGNEELPFIVHNGKQQFLYHQIIK